MRLALQCCVMYVSWLDHAHIAHHSKVGVSTQYVPSCNYVYDIKDSHC